MHLIKQYVNDNYLSLYGCNQMEGPLNVNDNRITGLTNNVLYLTKVAINSMLTMRLQKEILVILQKSISWMMLINGLQNGLQNGVVWC